MTELTCPTPHPTPRRDSVPNDRGRRVVGYVAMLSTLPYLVLKTMWSLGSTVGLADPHALDDPTIAALNWATGGLELVALVVALALTRPWGMRLPAWLISFPLWFGTGLLFPRIVNSVVAGVLLAGTRPPGGSGRSAQDLAEPWVFVVVPLAFAIQALALAAAFVLYVKTRWGRLLGARVGGARRGATGDLQSGLAVAATILLAAVTVLLLVWIVTDEPADRARAAVATLITVMWPVAAAVGLLVLVTRRFGRRLRLWVPLTLTWIGSGAMVGWGSWLLICALVPSDVTNDTAPPMLRVARLAITCTGLVMAVIAAFTVAERDIQSGTVTERDVRSGTVTARDIQSGTVTERDIQSGTVAERVESC